MTSANFVQQFSLVPYLNLQFQLRFSCISTFYVINSTCILAIFQSLPQTRINPHITVAPLSPANRRKPWQVPIPKSKSLTNKTLHNPYFSPNIKKLTTIKINDIPPSPANSSPALAPATQKQNSTSAT